MFDQIGVYLGLFVTGMAMSLHCIGMCGPLVIGFSKAFNHTALTIEGAPAENKNSRWKIKFKLDFLWYHIGRIWTYTLLGILAGFMGQGLQSGAQVFQDPSMHRIISLIMSGLVVLCGVLLLGVVPKLNIDRWIKGCSGDGSAKGGWLSALLSQHGIAPRLLLGAMMGLLPCGLVYGMLVIAASLGGPVQGGIGMFMFGLGTLPGLTGVLIANGLIPIKWRARGGQLAAVMMIGLGLWLGVRAYQTEPGKTTDCGCGDVTNPTGNR